MNFALRGLSSPRSQNILQHRWIRGAIGAQWQAKAWLAAFACLLANVVSFAQGSLLNFDNRDFAKAVGNMLVTDTLQEGCPQGSQALAVKNWETGNRVPRLRQAVKDAQQSEHGREVFKALRSGVTSKLAPMKQQSCQVLVQWLASPESQIRQQQPEIY